MNNKPNPELIDDENPEWTDEMLAQAKRISNLPLTLQAKLRGPQKAPTKRPTTIRLSPEVVDAFKATGDGWQTRIDAALKDWLRKHSPAQAGLR
jgi:uncharacterized protein (DUF4415 family)